MNNKAIDILKEKLNQAGILWEKDQLNQFREYHKLLRGWNRRINLISRSDEEKIIERHFLESLAVMLHCKIQSKAAIVDVGSGGGFPGIPVAIMRPDVNFTLIESKRLKSLFLKEVVSNLRLKNVTVVNERCEKIAESGRLEGSFDWAFTRAVGELRLVYGLIKKMITPTGVLVAWKGGSLQKEIDALTDKFVNLVVESIKMDDRLVDPLLDRYLIIIKQKNGGR